MTTPVPDSPLHDLDGPADEWLDRIRRAEEPRRNGCIGSYEILEEVGHGGQGIVFRARQAGTGREIALKRLASGVYSSAASRRRFEREIQLAAQLVHPGIVATHGVEQVDGVPLLAMEWVDGRPITRWAAEQPAGRAGLEHKLRMFLQVCEAVQHAHGCGVIHRDLKPTNVLVDTSGRCRLLDFGLASRQDAEDEVTRTLGFVGTPAYAPPEHFTEGEAPLDVRSDVYSLGVLLYECLTGLRPFRAARLPELITEIAQREPERPSRAARGLDGELDAVVLRACAKRPEERYPTVHALAEDLRRYLDGRSLQAVPPRTAYLVRKWIRRNRLAFGFSLALAAAVLAFAVIALRQAATIAAERDAVRDALGRVEQQAAKAQVLEEFYHDAIHSAVNPSRSTPTRSVRDVLEYEALHAKDRLGAHPPVVVETLLQIAEDFRWLDDVDRSRELNLEALALLDTLPAPDPELRAVLLGRIGLDGIYRGLHEESLAQIEESVSIYAGLGAKPAEHSIALGRLGEAQLRTGRFEEALATYREALRLAWEARDPLSISLIAGNVALVQVLVYDPEPAEAMLVEALAFVEREAPAGSVAIPNVRTSLATWLFETGRFEEAVELQERALEEVRALFDPGHTEFLKVQVSLGRSLVAAGRTDEALAHFRPVAASGSSFHVALARFGQGLCALAAGAVEEGIAHIRAAWPGILEWMAQGDPFRIEYAFVLLSALVRAERYEQAEEQYASLAAELRAATRYGVAPKPEALPQAFQDVLVLGLEQEFAALLDEVLATLGERLPARQRAAIAAVRPQALDAAAPPAAR